MAFTRIPDVKQALEQLLAGVAALDGVAVSWGHRDPPLAEMIEILDADSEDREGRIRPQPMPVNERISLRIAVSVMRPGAVSWADTERRLWVICEAIDSAFRADVTLGGILLMGSIARARQFPFRAQAQRGQRAILELTGEARIEAS